MILCTVSSNQNQSPFTVFRRIKIILLSLSTSRFIQSPSYVLEDHDFFDPTAKGFQRSHGVNCCNARSYIAQYSNRSDNRSVLSSPIDSYDIWKTPLTIAYINAQLHDASHQRYASAPEEAINQKNTSNIITFFKQIGLGKKKKCNSTCYTKRV